MNINITCTENVKNKQITIVFANEAFVSANFMTSDYITEELEAFTKLSQD